MCLSTAVRDSDPEDILMEYVNTVRIEGDTVILTDLMGSQKEIKGTLTYADLTGALLKIDC